MVSTGRTSPSKKLGNFLSAQSPRKPNQFIIPPPVDEHTDSSQLSCHSIVKRRRTARRNLFGRPQADDTNNWLQGLENSMMEAKIEKWGFDFRNDKPMDVPSTSTSSQSSSSVCYEPMDTSNVPHFYHSKAFVEASPQKGRRVPHRFQGEDLEVLQPLRAFGLSSARRSINFACSSAHSNGPESPSRAYHSSSSPTKLRKHAAPVVHKTPGKKGDA